MKTNPNFLAAIARKYAEIESENDIFRRERQVSSQMQYNNDPILASTGPTGPWD